MPRRKDIARVLITRPLLALAMSFFLVVFASPSQACSISISTVHVSSNFRVVVSHDSTPIAGIKVQVFDAEEMGRSNDVPEWKPILQLVTARDGAAEVKNLRSGRYLVETTGPGGGDAVYALVGAGRSELSTQVSLQWPFSLRGTLKTKSLSGELVSNNPWSPFQNIQVKLWAAGVESPLATEDTGPQGRFLFHEIRPGIYVVSIQGRQDHENANNQVQGYLAVELSPSAPDALPSLSFRLEMTTCGIEYSTCPPAKATITTASRRLRVMYTPGMSEYPGIKNARFELLDDQKKVIMEGTTDDSGTAELPSNILGKATLIVASPLMTTAHQLLDLLPSDESSSELVVTMTTMSGPENECSVVALEKHAPPQ